MICQDDCSSDAAVESAVTALINPNVDLTKNRTVAEFSCLQIWLEDQSSANVFN